MYNTVFSLSSHTQQKQIIATTLQPFRIHILAYNITMNFMVYTACISPR